MTAQGAGIQLQISTASRDHHTTSCARARQQPEWYGSQKHPLDGRTLDVVYTLSPNRRCTLAKEPHHPCQRDIHDLHVNGRSQRHWHRPLSFLCGSNNTTSWRYTTIPTSSLSLYRNGNSKIHLFPLVDLEPQLTIVKDKHPSVTCGASGLRSGSAGISNWCLGQSALDSSPLSRQPISLLPVYGR